MTPDAIVVSCPYCGAGAQVSGWECPSCRQVIGPRGEAGKNAMAAFVLGILGLMFYVFLIPCIVAIVLANMSRAQHEPGQGFATAGRTLGWVGVAMFLLIIPVFIIFMAFGFFAALAGLAGGTPLN